MVERQTPELEVRGFKTYPCHVVSLSKTRNVTLLPESSGNTQEAVAPSRHD